MIVDAHVHIFPRFAGYGPGGKVADFPRIRVERGDGAASPAEDQELTCHPLEMQLENMERCGVDRAVLISTPGYGDWNDYVRDACARYPDRFVGVSFWDPWRDDARDYFAREIAGRGWRHVKIEFSDGSGLRGFYPDARLDAGEVMWFWDEAEARGLTVVLDLGKPGDGSYQTEQLRNVILGHPNLRVVICHLAQPGIALKRDANVRKAWYDQLALANYPNVYFDISAMASNAQVFEAFPYPTTKWYFDLAREVVSADKLMWGSDVPWQYCAATYAQLLEHGRSLVRDLPEVEREKILGGNALRVYWGSREGAE